jgi:dTDP-4-amino-4,6-dideoxygalactose transaminase
MTIFSFHPVKTITTGEGGAIMTNSEKLYKKLVMLRSHGVTKENESMSQNPGDWYYEMQYLGFNYRMTDFQASLGISQLKKLDKFAKRRREIVDKYNRALKELDWLKTPVECHPGHSVFHLYVLQIDFKKIAKTRKEVMDILRSKSVGTQVHYIPVHTQPYYKNKYNYNWGDYPVAEEYYQKALSIPLYPKMNDDDVDYVIESVKGLASE